MRLILASRGISVTCGFVQCFLDAQQLIVLSDTIRTAQGTGLNLSCIGSNGNIRNGGILRFTAPVRYNSRIAVTVRELSKIHEEVQSGTLNELADFYQTTPPKGEFVLLVQGTDELKSSQKKEQKRKQQEQEP